MLYLEGVLDVILGLCVDSIIVQRDESDLKCCKNAHTLVLPIRG